MNEKPIHNPPLSKADLKRISTLKQSDVAFIDAVILSCTAKKYLKQALIIIKTSEKVNQKLNAIPLTYYSLRIQELVNKKLLEAVGDLNSLRHSEIRKMA